MYVQGSVWRALSSFLGLGAIGFFSGVLLDGLVLSYNLLAIVVIVIVYYPVPLAPLAEPRL